MLDPNFADQVLQEAVKRGNSQEELQSHLDSLDAAGQEQFINEAANSFGLAGDSLPSEVTPEVQAQRDALPKMMSAEEADASGSKLERGAREVMGQVLSGMSKYSEIASAPIDAAHAGILKATGLDDDKSFDQLYSEIHGSYKQAAKEIQDSHKLGTFAGDVAGFINVGNALEKTGATMLAKAGSAMPKVASVVSKIKPLFYAGDDAYKATKIAQGGLRAAVETAAVEGVRQADPDAEKKTLGELFKTAGVVGVISSVLPAGFYAPQLIREGKAGVATLKNKIAPMGAGKTEELNSVLDLIKKTGSYAKAKEVGEAAMEYTQKMGKNLGDAFQKAMQQGGQQVEAGLANNPVAKEMAENTGRVLNAIVKSTEANSKEAAEIVVGGQQTLNKFYNTVEAKASAEYGRTLTDLGEHMEKISAGTIDDAVDAYTKKAILEGKIVKTGDNAFSLAPDAPDKMSMTEFRLFNKLQNMRGKEMNLKELNQLKREIGGSVRFSDVPNAGSTLWQDVKSKISDGLENAGKGDVNDTFLKVSNEYFQVKGLLGQVKKITNLGDEFAQNPMAKSARINGEKVGSTIDNLTSDEAIMKMDFDDASVIQLTQSMKALNKIADQKAVNRLVTNRASFSKRVAAIAKKREENIAQGLDEYAMMNPKEQETMRILEKGVADTGKLLDEFRVASNIKGMPKVLNDALKNPKDGKVVEAAISLARKNMKPQDFAVYRDTLEAQRKRFIALDGKPGKDSYKQILDMLDDPTKDASEKQEIALMAFGPEGDKFMEAVTDGRALKALTKMEKMIGGDPTTSAIPQELKELFADKAQNIMIRGAAAFYNPWTLVAEQLIKAFKNPQKAIYLAKTGLLEESEIKALQNYYKLARKTIDIQAEQAALANAAKNSTEEGNFDEQRQ